MVLVEELDGEAYAALGAAAAGPAEAAAAAAAAEGEEPGPGDAPAEGGGGASKAEAETRKRKLAERKEKRKKQKQKQKQKRAQAKDAVAAGGAAETAEAGASGRTEAGGGAAEAEEDRWGDFELDAAVGQQLRRLGFREPTPVQAEALPLVLRDGKDVVAAAQTGSGKTLAFGLPIVDSILRERRAPAGAPGGLRALILTPTRELAIQVKDHIEAVAKPLGVHAISIVGGMAHEKQERQLAKGPPIVIATPGRLWEYMERNEAHLRDLAALRYFVIDEADRMVEHGHFAEVAYILERVNLTPAKESGRRTLIFSATLTLPPSMLKAKGKARKNIPSLQNLMRRVQFREKPAIVDLTTVKKTASGLHEAALRCADDGQAESHLYVFLATTEGHTIVFCNSISSIRRLASLLKILGMPVGVLHAEQQQRQRLKALDAFKAGKCSVLLATDVAARGLDITGVKCVLQFHIPKSADTYIHRAGRTARAGGSGISVVFVRPKEAGSYHTLCRKLGRTELLPEFPLDRSILAKVHQRANLAKKIDTILRKHKKKDFQKEWEKRQAAAAEIILDEEGDEEGERAARGRELAECRALQTRLSGLLVEPLARNVGNNKFLAGRGGVAAGMALQSARKKARKQQTRKKGKGVPFVLGRQGKGALELLVER